MGVFDNKECKNIIFILLIIAGVYLAMRFLVPLAAPFLLAFLLVAPIYPFLSKIHNRTRIGKGFLAGAFLVLVLAIIGGGACFLFGKLFSSMGNLILGFDNLEREICCLITDCCKQLELNWGINAEEIETFVLERVTIFAENIQVQVVPKLMGESITYAKEMVSLGAAFVVTLISSVLLAKDYDAIRTSLQRQKGFRIAAEITGKIGKMLAVFVKAQGLIMLSISIICILGYLLMGMKNPIFLGILTGFLDLLPFIGTGIMLVPLTIFHLLQGELWEAGGSLLLYIVCSFTREMLEPKLIGDRMGIFPIGILIAIYMGIKLYGLKGILLGPLSILLVMEISKKILARENEKTVD